MRERGKKQFSLLEKKLGMQICRIVAHFHSLLVSARCALTSHTHIEFKWTTINILTVWAFNLRASLSFNKNNNMKNKNNQPLKAKERKSEWNARRWLDLSLVMKSVLSVKQEAQLLLLRVSKLIRWAHESANNDNRRRKGRKLSKKIKRENWVKFEWMMLFVERHQKRA